MIDIVAEIKNRLVDLSINPVFNEVIKKILPLTRKNSEEYAIDDFNKAVLCIQELSNDEINSFIENFEDHDKILFDILESVNYFMDINNNPFFDNKVFLQKISKFISNAYLLGDFVKGLKSKVIENRVGDFDNSKYPEYNNTLEYIRLHYNSIKEFIELYKSNVDLLNKSTQIAVEADDKVKKMEQQLTEAYSNLQIIIKSKTDKFDKLIVESENTVTKTKEQLGAEVQSIKQEAEQTVRRIEQTVEETNTKVLKNLQNIERDLDREVLSIHFYNERQKLKGDIGIDILIYASMLFVAFWNTELLKEYIINTRIIIELIGSYIASIFIIQIISNFIKCYNGERKKNDYNVSDGLDEVCISDLFKQSTLIKILTPYWCWLMGTFIGMLWIVKVALEVYDTYHGADGISYSKLLPYTAYYMILIWFTWFCAKQFSYVKQICDEYEYKYVLSKSYLRYRDEAKFLADKKGDVAILVALLDSVIRNIAQSPVQSVQRDCHTPFSEVFNTIKESAHIQNNSQ